MFLVSSRGGMMILKVAAGSCLMLVWAISLAEEAFGGEWAVTEFVQNGLKLSCPTGPQEACVALAKVVAARNLPTSSCMSGMTVELNITRAQPTFIEGHLAWQRDQQEIYIGPVMEVSVMDRTVGVETYEQLVIALLDNNTVACDDGEDRN